eukprot:1597948-Alexandrium_andersonii.AAC.1
MPEARPPDQGAPRRAMWYSCVVHSGPAGDHSPRLRLPARAGSTSAGRQRARRCAWQEKQAQRGSTAPPDATRQTTEADRRSAREAHGHSMMGQKVLRAPPTTSRKP